MRHADRSRPANAEKIAHAIDFYTFFIDITSLQADGEAEEWAFAPSRDVLLHKVIHRRRFFGRFARLAGNRQLRAARQLAA
ncbi:hypothetical protein AB3X91_15160 [Paraburkholderia sp. BR14263]|uniref:Uncharacterized protein n=1 Tax=Paraburkholderia guartelaensis TaxID=2546446 RepID=A0ABU9SIK0_9BURK